MKKTISYLLGLFIMGAVGMQQASALTVTQTGTLSADNGLFQYNFTLPSATSISLYTTSYAGGTNVNGTTAAAGGFVPNLTLFTGMGSVITSDGGTGTARGPLGKDAVTGLYDDAYIQTTLAAGSYILTLTEFPNVAINNLSDGFLFASDPHATGNFCGSSTGTFLQTDVSPCVQRTGSYSLNVNTTPEPATLWLIVPALGAAYVWRRRQALQS